MVAKRFYPAMAVLLMTILSSPTTHAAADDQLMISLNFEGGRLRRDTTEPFLKVFRDGTVIVQESFGTVSDRLTPGELAELNQFVMREKNFVEIDIDRIERDLRTAMSAEGRFVVVKDLASTVIAIDVDGTQHQAAMYAVEHYARAFPMIAELGRLEAIQRRLSQVVSRAQLGGSQGVAELLAVANKVCPDGIQMTAANVYGVQRFSHADLDVVFRCDDEARSEIIEVRVQKRGDFFNALVL